MERSRQLVRQERGGRGPRVYRTVYIPLCAVLCRSRYRVAKICGAATWKCLKSWFGSVADGLCSRMSQLMNSDTKMLGSLGRAELTQVNVNNDLVLNIRSSHTRADRNVTTAVAVRNAGAQPLRCDIPATTGTQAPMRYFRTTTHGSLRQIVPCIKYLRRGGHLLFQERGKGVAESIPGEEK